MSNQFDFLAIGDTVTDAFIRLEDSSAHISIRHDVREICMRFGDKVPYHEVFIIPAVGNSANAAVAAARLGLKSALVSNVGDDQYGKECLAALTEEKVATEFVKINPGYKTNYHYVLWYKDERTILVKHEPYEYTLPEIGEPTWVYLSSLGENSLEFHNTLERYFSEHPGIKLAFQPGTFQMKFGGKKLAGLYRRADVFFCNKEEAQRILETGESDIKKLLSMMAELGPKIVAITDGVNGAYVYDGSGPSTSSGQNLQGKFWSMRLYPDPKPPISRTGAGDAFSSTFTVALALGKDIPEALRWAPVSSMSVVQHVGARAGLLTREKLEEYLAIAPDDYFPKEI